MPLYRAKSLLFVDGARIRPGQVFSSNTTPNDQWEPVESAAEKQAKGKAQAEPVKAPEGPIDPFADKTDEQIRDFIETRSRNNKRPGTDKTREQLLEIAKRLSKPDGEQ